jgi:hypothetical protein
VREGYSEMLARTRWIHVPDHTPKNQKRTATATVVTAVSLILPKIGSAKIRQFIA